METTRISAAGERNTAGEGIFPMTAHPSYARTRYLVHMSFKWTARARLAVREPLTDFIGGPRQ